MVAREVEVHAAYDARVIRRRPGDACLHGRIDGVARRIGVLAFEFGVTDAGAGVQAPAV